MQMSLTLRSTWAAVVVDMTSASDVATVIMIVIMTVIMTAKSVAAAAGDANVDTATITDRIPRLPLVALHVAKLWGVEKSVPVVSWALNLGISTEAVKGDVLFRRLWLLCWLFVAS